MPDQTITSVSREHRKFRPSAEFKAQANLGSDAAYKRLYAESVNSPEKFWDKQAKEHLVWRKPYKKVLEAQRKYDAVANRRRSEALAVDWCRSLYSNYRQGK